MARLGRRAVTFDRSDGQELSDGAALREAIRGCDAVIHLAAFHPLIAPPNAGADAFTKANVPPSEALLGQVQRRDVKMVVLASSTAVWREAAPGEPARFLDETTPTDDTDDYAWSKIACEALLAATELPHIILRLARFASQGAGEDDVRKLYRPVDPRDAASAVVAALDLAGPRSMYAIAAPTPFRSEDAALLGRDARAAIRARTGTEPVWAPAHIGSVVVSSRAQEELGWRCVYPSTLLRVN